MNQFQIVAQVVEREILRYSPGGVPIVAARLAHSSQQLEAQTERLVEFEIAALAIGAISGQFSQLELGIMHCFTGFLARKNRNSKSLVFHIIEISEAGATN